MGGSPMKLDMGMMSDFGNPLGRNGTLSWVILFLW